MADRSSQARAAARSSLNHYRAAALLLTGGLLMGAYAAKVNAQAMGTRVSSMMDCQLLAARHGAPQGGCPIARAGLDSTVGVGKTALLDAGGSSHENNAVLSYNGDLVQKPLHSEAKLEHADTPNARFTPDRRGAYVVHLQVSDADGNQSSDFVTISTINSRPHAEAGRDLVAPEGARVTLNGLGSRDADGDDLRYHWVLEYAPEHSQSALDHGDSATPSILLDRKGEYSLRLTVEDGRGRSAPDRVRITTGG